MSTKIVRKIDSLGRIVLPMEMVKALYWSDGTKIAITQQDNTLTLQKNQESCLLCGNTCQLQFFRRQCICKTCIDELISQSGQSL